MDEPILLAPGTKVAVMTGAGISAESGIRTFRDAGGLWEDHKVEDVASPDAWRLHPERVWRFYSERRAQLKSALPNPAHHALAALEAALGDDFFLCTQNVDALHEMAGSTRVVHMHGELMKTRCEDPACPTEPFSDASEYYEEVPRCTCGARLRPHIVWFGEMPFEMHSIKRTVQACDWFLTIGTSGRVYPAAGLIREVTYRQQCGEPVRSMYVGLEPPDNAAEFDDVRLGRAGEILPGAFAVTS